MKLIWMLFILPVATEELPVKFPGSFVTEDACKQFAELLLTKRDFTCEAEEERELGPVLAG